MVLVVGETARADHFSLNGYECETNPELSKLNVLNFTQVHSCGTSTAVSVPCMFSMFPREDYSDHSVLGLFDVKTSLYQPGLDIFHGCRPAMTAAQ